MKNCIMEPDVNTNLFLLIYDKSKTLSKENQVLALHVAGFSKEIIREANKFSDFKIDNSYLEDIYRKHKLPGAISKPDPSKVVVVKPESSLVWDDRGHPVFLLPNGKSNWHQEDNELFKQINEQAYIASHIMRVDWNLFIDVDENKELTYDDRLAMKKEAHLKAFKLRKEVLNREKIRKNNYQSPLAQFLPDRSREEIDFVETVLHDDTEFKYKSDKIKALLKGGVPSIQIVNVINQRPDMTINLSYVESLKAKMNES